MRLLVSRYYLCMDVCSQIARALTVAATQLLLAAGANDLYCTATLATLDWPNAVLSPNTPDCSEQRY